MLINQLDYSSYGYTIFHVPLEQIDLTTKYRMSLIQTIMRLIFLAHNQPIITSRNLTATD